MYGTYNLMDDKLRLYPDGERFQSEKFRQLCQLFTWARLQECFVGVWTPAREDEILKFVDDILPDDMTPLERAEIKADRLRERSGKAYCLAVENSNRAHDIAERLQGEPIKLDHHSAGKHIKAINTAENSMRRFVEFYDKSKQLENKAERSINHAIKLEDPGVIARRIQKLESEKRSFQRRINESDEFLRWIDHHENLIDFWKSCLDENGGIVSDNVEVCVGDIVVVSGFEAEVLKINKKTVKIKPLHAKYLEFAVDKSKITEVKPKNA